LRNFLYKNNSGALIVAACAPSAAIEHPDLFYEVAPAGGAFAQVSTRYLTQRRLRVLTAVSA
jgi:hypothetical protein